MTIFLCRIRDRMSEFFAPELSQVVVIDADSFEDAASRVFPGMEVHDPLPTGHDDSRIVCARFLPANEIGITHRYTTSGYGCQRFASMSMMPEGWTPHPPKVDVPAIKERTLRQWTLEAWC